MTALSARVLVVGAGGLGCSATLALARAGIRDLTLADPDRVEVSNLPRQLWFRTQDIGARKAACAAERLRAAFPNLKVESLADRVDGSNAAPLFRRHELVLDATDGSATKFALSDASVETGVPLVYGGAVRLVGQAMLIRPRGPCLRCLFEAPPPDASTESCGQAGVLGSLVGAVGALQALLAVEWLGVPRRDSGPTERLITFDASTGVQRSIEVPRREDCPACSGAQNRAGRPEPAREVPCPR